MALSSEKILSELENKTKWKKNSSAYNDVLDIIHHYGYSISGSNVFVVYCTPTEHLNRTR